MGAATVLDRPTLVLNKNWQPLHATTVKEAIALVAKGSARIIESGTYQPHDLMSWADVSKAKIRYSDAVIHSARISIVAPEVILLTRYDGQGERSVVFSRRNLFKRDKYCCQYCNKQFRSENAMKDLTIDHILPRSRGGKSSWENCVLACVDCNKRKANRTPDEAKMTLRRDPKKPKWSAFDHIGPGRRFDSWKAFLDEAFWNVKLEP